MSHPTEMIRAEDVKPFWTPKTPPVKTQCSTCPFGPNGHTLVDPDEAFAHAKKSADMGLDFHCHSTVYKNVLKPGQVPSMQPRDQWRTCAGAVAYRQTCEVEVRKATLRKQGRLIE